MPALGDGDTCEDAYKQAEQVCNFPYRCTSSERKFCDPNTGQ
jgi:hypothetical protein